MSDSYSAIQTLQTQIRLTNSALAAATAASLNAQAASPSVGLSFLPTQEVVANGGDGGGPPVAWTTYNFLYVPASASAVLLQVSARRDSATSGEKYIYGRASSSGTSILLYGSNSDGVDTDTEGSTAQFFCPVSSGSFQWSADAGMQFYTITVVGYLS